MSEGTRDSMALAIGRQLVDGVMNSLSPQDLAVLARRYDLVLLPEKPPLHPRIMSRSLYQGMIDDWKVKPE